MNFAAQGDVAGVLQRLADGVSPNVTNPIGQTALHIAAIWNHVEVATVLLDAGANVNQKNQYGVTPLLFAAQKDHLEVSRVLVQRGADINVKGGNGRKPWESASGALRDLLGGPSNPLHNAMKARDLGKLQTLLDGGECDVSATDNRGRTALHLAALYTLGSEAGLKLGDKSSNPEGSGNDGLDALQMLVAAAARQPPKGAGAACDILDDDGTGALHMLVRGDHVAGATLLLVAGADPNLRSQPNDSEYRSNQWGKKVDGAMEAIGVLDDLSPLHMALDCEEPSATMIDLLLEHRADPNVRDAEKRTPLHIALDFDEDRNGVDLVMAEKMLQKGADASLGSNEIGLQNSCVHAAVDHSDAATLELLLKYGAPHSAAGKGGFTPLCVAARSGNLACAMPLLAAGADPDAPTAAGKSAREYATLNKRTKLLEAFDANVHTAALLDGVPTNATGN